MQQGKLAATGVGAGDELGFAVALNGTTTMVGAPADDDAGIESGSAFVFVRGGSWAQQQKLVPADGTAGAEFGSSVALSGNTAVVGSPGDDDFGAGAGSAYVFVRSGSTWTQQQKLVPADLAANDSFGLSVAIDGDTAVVGTPFGGSTDAGAAYVFTRSGSVWTQAQKVVPTGGGPGDQFGFSVSLSGSNAVIGAPFDGQKGGDAGAAYVFTKSGAVWSQQAKLLAADGQAGDQLGFSVAASGSRVILGAVVGDGAVADSGAAYIFEQTGSSWSLQQKLAATGGTLGSDFGYSVSLAGDLAVVGAPRAAYQGALSGSAHAFQRVGATWTEQPTLLAVNGAGPDQFGISVSASSGNAVVGAIFANDPALDSGAASWFEGAVAPAAVPALGNYAMLLAVVLLTIGVLHRRGARRAGIVTSLMCVLVLVGGALGCAPEGPSDETVLTSREAIDENAAVVIREIYVGPAGPDYVRIFNRGTTPVVLTGWSIQMGSATGTMGGPSHVRLVPNGTLAAGQTLRVWLGLHDRRRPTIWSDETVPAAAAGGKIALVRSTAPLNCGNASTPCSPAALVSIVDLAGWGTSDFFEGTGPAPALDGNNALIRKSAGSTDGNQNADDFSVGPTAPDPVNECDPDTIRDPRSVTALDPTIVTSFATAAAPLYEGGLAIQKPVAAGAIDPKRVAVIDGRVLDEAGNPAVCAEVTLVGGQQYGTTYVRKDGSFSLAMNGGGTATVRVVYPGFIAAHRSVSTFPNRFARATDVRLVSYGPSQPVTSAATGATVVTGTAETDANGSRQAALLFPPGTTANVAGEPSPRTSYRVSAKELTNRNETGREGMPASLPPQSAFTYAVNLAVEGAEGKDVTFNNPVPVYVDNFLNFPNGENVPVGRFDPVSAQWVAEANGRVVSIAGITGGQATLNIDASPGADDPTPLGVTTAELTALAARYPVGKSLWRFATNHFSDWDANWGWGPPAGAQPPDNSGGGPPEGPSCKRRGSIIECENQVLLEQVPVTATPFNLVYSSARQASSARRLLVPLTKATLPPGLQALDVRIEVAGRSFTPTLSPTANLTYEFVWDGLDSAGRRLSGPQDVRTSVGYVYNGSYEQTTRFGYDGNGIPISGSLDRFQATLWQYSSSKIGNVDARYPGLGNWTLDVHHVLDRARGTLYLGNGEQQTGERTILTTIAGNGVNGPNVDGGPATSSPAKPVLGLVVAPDGVVYFTDSSWYVRKIDTNGIMTTIAGDGFARTVFWVPSGIALGPDGYLYVADRDFCRVRKVHLSTYQVTTVVGDAAACSATDGPADPLAPGAARLQRPQGLTFGSDGTLYIADTYTLRRLRDGQVSTVAAGFTDLTGVAVRSDGTLFASHGGAIYKISLNGTVSLYAGGSGSSTADGVPATSARMGVTDGIAVGPDDLVYYADAYNEKIRRINTDGTVQSIVGTGVSGFNGDGSAPTRSSLYAPAAVTFGPDGSLYVADRQNFRIRKVVPKDGINLPSGVFGIASTDGQELYQFDVNGRHLRTLDTHSGAARYTFSYDAQGLLSAVTDASGRSTTIVRSGSTITIAAPDQQPTTLLLDADKNLERLTRPDGTFYSFGYALGGLLTSLKDPKANAEAGLPAVFTYDNGLLIEDTDARPGATPQTLSRTSLSGTTGWSVTHETPNGRATTYRTELASGVRKRTITQPDGTSAVEEVRADGATVFIAPTNNRRYDHHVRQPDGTDIWTLNAPHPAYGGQDANFAEQQTRLPSGLIRLITQTSAATVNATTGALLSETLTTVTNSKPPSTVTYDAATRTFTTTSAAGRTSSTVLDTAGRTTQISVAGISNPTSFQYDSAGRLFRITQGNRTTDLGYFPPGSALKTGYLQSTQTYAVPSPPLTATTFDRDALGRVLQSTTGGATTSTTWDANGSLASVSPPEKPTHTLVYDAINQLVTYTPPVVAGVPSPATSYSFDLDRNVDGETRPGSILLDSAYDAAGRLDSITIPGGLLDQTYYSTTPPTGGSPGRLNTLLGPYGVNLAYRYDGSLTTRVTWSGLVNGNINWTYNSDFLPTIEAVTPGTGPAVSVRFGYDVDNLTTCASLTSCTPPASDALNITRSPTNGLVSTVSLGSVTETYGYNDYGELASQASTSGATPLVALSYDTSSFPRDALGRIKRKTETVAGITTNVDYTYDDLGRLTDVYRNGVLDEHFEYDTNGNRTLGFNAGAGTTHSGTYDNQDRLLSYGPSTFTYTPNGELASRTTSGQTSNYTYDALGNLLSVTLPGGTTIAYLVDGQNRRVGKRVNGVLIKQWLYKDALRPVVELDGSGAVVARFVYASGRHLPDYIIRGGNTYRVLADQLGSPRMAVNVANSSDVPFRAEYSSFGVQTMISGTADWMPFGFAGGVYDADTGLVRFGARDYDPTVGRWVSKDPIRFVGSETNLYVYAGDDPTNAVDPGGERPSPACVARAREVCQEYCWGCGQSACVEICTDLAANWVCKDCDGQYESDNDVCRSLPDPGARSRCFGSATARYGACRAGKALPPLITW